MDALRIAGFNRVVARGLLTIAVAGCSFATVTPSASVPGSTSSVTAASIASTAPSPSAIVSPSPQPTNEVPPALQALPVTAVSADQLHRGLGSPASVARGPLVYTVGEAAAGEVTVTVTDISTGDIASVAAAIPADEVISWDYWDEDPVATDGRYLVVLASHPFTPPEGPIGIPSCVPSGRDWQLLTATIDPATGLPSSGFTVFASGTTKLGFLAPRAGEAGDCWNDNTTFAVDAGLIAYTVDDVTPSRPEGSRILIRSLSDGSILRKVQANQFVYAVRLSGTTIAWAESQDETVQPVPQIRIRASTSAHPSPWICSPVTPSLRPARTCTFPA